MTGRQHSGMAFELSVMSDATGTQLQVVMSVRHSHGSGLPSRSTQGHACMSDNTRHLADARAMSRALFHSLMYSLDSKVLDQWHETHRVIFFIHAVSNEVSSVILIHTQGLDSVASVAPRALHLNGRISMLMRHL